MSARSSRSERALLVVFFPVETLRTPVAVPAAAGAVVDHLGLQGQPAARAQRLDDVGLVRGGLRVAAAARPERDDDRGGGERLQPVHVPHQGAQSHVIARSSAWRAWSSPCRRPARSTQLLGGVPGMFDWSHDRAAAGRRRDDLLRHQHAGDRHRDRAVDAAVDPQDLERELPVERAELLRRRRRRGRCRRGWSLDHAHWLAVLADGAALPHLPHLQGLSRPHRRRAAPRARDGGSAPRDDRSAGAGDRREGSDVAVAHPPGAALCGGGRARARHDRERDPGREDGGAAARHRQARGARAHPVEAGPADARRVPEDPRASEGRRRHRQLRAVPVSGGAADPEPSRALGRQGLSGRAARARTSRSARASCRSSTTSTR